MDKLILSPVLFLIIVIIAIGCSEKIVDNGQSESLNVTISASLSSFGSIQEIDNFLLQVSGPGIGSPIRLRGNILADGKISGQVAVPSGRQRKFVLIVFNKSGIPMFMGSTVTDLSVNSRPELTIMLYPQVPMIKMTPHKKSILWGQDFAIDVEVYNIVDLHSISFDIFYDVGALIYADSVKKGSSLSSTATISISSGDISLNVTATERDLPGLIVDEAGYSHLGVIYFSSAYAGNQAADTALMSITPVLLINSLGDSIPSVSIYTENNSVILAYPDYYGVGYWKLNEAEGNIVFDSSGNGLDGVAHGTNMEGGAVSAIVRYFNGTSDYIEVPDNDLLDLTGGITIAMDVRIDPSETDAVLLCKRAPRGNINYLIRFYKPDSLNGMLLFAFGPSENQGFEVPANIADNQWHHIIISVPFRDLGASYWMVDWQIGLGGWPDADLPRVTGNSGSLLFGKQAAADPKFFHGAMSEIEIYEIAIPPQFFGR